ncbi:MAG: ABC transporter permease [Puniceicoccales bacterium]|nr:ABC transporter permease [Puniceicoccales bacterium]
MVKVDIACAEELDLIRVGFEGEWRMDGEVPTVTSVISSIIRFKNSKCHNVAFDLSQLRRWDTSFVSFTIKLAKFLKMCGLKFDQKCLPSEMLNIISLASPKHAPTSETNCETKASPGRLWKNLLEKFRNRAALMRENLNFIGELIVESGRTLCGRAKFRWGEFLTIVEQVGADALPIVALISFLVGLILAFVGIIQLRKFGVGIYCADLVGIAMMREMACLMTAVIMSGRTGAAFAATIGTMVVNEEIDAMQTAGFSRFEFIILPRVFALVAMMPLLCIFSGVIGICGGMFASIVMLNMNISQYFTQTKSAIALSDVFCGLSKSVVFAILIASIGCLKGTRCGRDSESVGRVTTSAVVTSITAIIIADAVFALIFNAIGI